MKAIKPTTKKQMPNGSADTALNDASVCPQHDKQQARGPVTGSITNAKAIAHIVMIITINPNRNVTA
jgi:hypothetical protein